MSFPEKITLERLYSEAVAPFAREIERLTPAGAEIVDAHTHLGIDEDGRSLDVDGLLSMLDRAGAARACVFALHDPERKPAYTAPNDRILGWAKESEGRLIPFCRLDPAEGPIAEAERCISAGARGIKLHPRAQEFDFAGKQMDAIFALAEDARVPILIHAGRGLPPLADGLTELALRHPLATLILAHAAICDQGLITETLSDHPGVLYDTSCFFPMDLMELMALVPAERIVFASDPPYGSTPSGLYLVLRAAAQARLDEQTLKLMLGGTISQLIDHGWLPQSNPPRRPPTITLSGRLARVYGYASLAGPAMFAGVLDQAQTMIDMALAACRCAPSSGPGNSQSPTEWELELLDVICSALTAAGQLVEVGDGNPASIGRSIDLLYRAISLAATAIADPAT